jgi:hypothetical protein
MTTIITTIKATTIVDTRRSMANELHMERMETQPLLTIFKLPKLQVPTNISRSAKGQPFEFGLGRV